MKKVFFIVLNVWSMVFLLSPVLIRNKMKEHNRVING